MEIIKEIIKKNNGITLIALVITIIILLILSGVAISTILGENGLIEKTKQAQIEQEKAQRREELVQKIYALQIKIFDEQGREATLDDFYELINDDEELDFINATYKVASTEVVSGEYETIRVLYSGYIFTVDSTLNITNVEECSEIANVDLSYEIAEKKIVDSKIIYKILVKLKSDEKIIKVEYPDGDVINYQGENPKEEIAIDYEVELGVEYTFKVYTLNGKKADKKLIINSENINGYVIEIYGIQGGDCSVLTEIELNNSEDELLSEHYYNGERNDNSFYNFNIEAYDSYANSKPPYWDRVNCWDKLQLFDGDKTYGASSSTSFCDCSNGKSWARLLIYNLSGEVNKIKIYSGSAVASHQRYPIELSVYHVQGYKDQIIEENLKTKDNDDNMVLWGKQQVSTDDTVIAENIFIKP